MIPALLVLLIVVIAIYVFMQQPQFGKSPSGENLERLKRSPHYRDGAFQNIHHTPALAEGVSYAQVMRQFFFTRRKRGKPSVPLPSMKTDLFKLDSQEDVLVWFGHSSYFMQLDGKKFLVDPVLSGGASPLSFTTRSFKGSDVYTVDDIPAIDYLLISHDHYDHLDYKTVTKLRTKVNQVITGLGTGGHLERWGFHREKITELDWDQHMVLEQGVEIRAVTARHFSGRSFKRNNTLWLSFVLQTPSNKIFIGGDSGYDDHFKKIGENHGPFDLAILENGQYNQNWKYIHMMPEEVVQAAEDLRAQTLLPVHWSKFLLSLHAWDEPIIRVTDEARRKGMPTVHPMIGEALHLHNMQTTAAWWERLDGR